MARKPKTSAIEARVGHNTDDSYRQRRRVSDIKTSYNMPYPGKGPSRPWNPAYGRNMEKLEGSMGRVRYEEDGADYRNFERIYSGPTDAVGVSLRRRREANMGVKEGKPRNKKKNQIKKNAR
jgi:hypothetical protein